MQIVIEIPDNEIPTKQDIVTVDLHFIDGKVCECDYPFMELPKGHGRLIDADKFDVYILKDKSEEFVNGAERVLAQIDDAPIVIEADKENE